MYTSINMQFFLQLEYVIIKQNILKYSNADIHLNKNTFTIFYIKI